VRGDLNSLLGNGDIGNHVTEQPMEVATPDPNTVERLPPQPTRLSNGVEAHFETESTQGDLPNEGSNGVSNVDDSSDSDDDDVISDILVGPRSRSPTKEVGDRHYSAMSVTEETKALDEALSRTSMTGEESLPELNKNKPELYEALASSSSEEDVKAMDTAASVVPNNDIAVSLYYLVYL